MKPETMTSEISKMEIIENPLISILSAELYRLKSIIETLINNHQSHISESEMYLKVHNRLMKICDEKITE